MKKNAFTTIVAALAISLMTVLFFTGASSQKEGGRWTISAVSGEINGLYIMDQSTGDIYFLDDDPNIARSHAKIKKLGNISSAR